MYEETTQFYNPNLLFAYMIMENTSCILNCNHTQFLQPILLTKWYIRSVVSEAGIKGRDK